MSDKDKVFFSNKDINFYGDTEKEKQLNKKLFEDSLLIAQKDDEIRELKDKLQQKENIIKEAFKYVDDKLREINLQFGSDNEFREEWDYLWEILDKEKW